MMKEQVDVEDLRASLQAVGVPDFVIDAALRHRMLPWLEAAQTVGFLAILVTGFAVGGLWIWPALERLTADNAREHAEAVGGLLYNYNFGFSLVLALFAWIAIASLPIIFLGSATAQMRANTFVMSVVQSQRSAFTLWAIRKELKALEGESDPERYFRKATTDSIILMAAISAALSALSIAAVFRDVQAHRVYTAEGYINSPFFPWASRDLRRWEDATRVELGCNYIADEDRGVVIYRVHFPDGAVADPASATALSGSWVDRLQEVDAALRQSEAKFERWRWLNRDPIHPRCLERMLNEMGPYYPSLQVMLRTGGYPGSLD